MTRPVEGADSPLETLSLDDGTQAGCDCGSSFFVFERGNSCTECDGDHFPKISDDGAGRDSAQGGSVKSMTIVLEGAIESMPLMVTDAVADIEPEFLDADPEVCCG